MRKQIASNRRTFLQAMGAASVWSSLSATSAIAETASIPEYAYVGSLGSAGRDGIEVFRVAGTRWTRLGRVPSEAPVSLMLHPNGHILYAVNRVALHQNLPRGTVEAFSIDRQSGALSLIQRQALSLSGTEPRSLAISPDGRHLVIAVYGGGAYNVLSIQQNGTLADVSRTLKELGCGKDAKYQAAAHPHTVLFDDRGRFALTSDLGCDQLSVFALNDEGKLQRTNKVRVASGAGPGSMILHPGGSLLYVKHELEPAIACYRYRSSDGAIGEHFQIVPLSGGREDHELVGGSLTIDARGRFLYATSAKGITVWAINLESGFLSIQHQAEDVDALHLSQHHGVLHALDGRSDSVLQMSLNATSGRWNDRTQVASVASPVSLALLFR